jgi:carbonic anhydrase
VRSSSPLTPVVIVGHTDCGGCKAAHQAALDAKHKRSEAPSVGPLDHFLQPLINLHHEIGTDKSVLDLVLANVNRSVHNVAESEVFQKAWEGGWNVSVHGLLYNVSSGFLTDLALSQYNTC